MGISVEIWRDSRWCPYNLDLDLNTSLTVLDVLSTIKEDLDPTLSYRSMCRSGICGTCAVRVNSKPVLACKTRVAEFGSFLKIEPLFGLPVVRDLVVDHDILVNRVKGISLKERKQHKVVYPEDLLGVQTSSECILCGICDSVCPVILEAPYFGGPMAFLRAYKHVVNGYEENTKSIGILLKKKFITLCTHCKNCSISCPKFLYPERAISKEEEILVSMGIIQKDQSGFDFLSF